MYENIRRVIYDIKGDGKAAYVPVCPTCGRFVKADESFSLSYYKKGVDVVNATCTKCGRVKMPFEGIF